MVSLLQVAVAAEAARSVSGRLTKEGGGGSGGR